MHAAILLHRALVVESANHFPSSVRVLLPLPNESGKSLAVRLLPYCLKKKNRSKDATSIKLSTKVYFRPRPPVTGTVRAPYSGHTDSTVPPFCTSTLHRISAF